MTFGWGELTLATLIGALLGKIISHFLAKGRSKQDRKIARYNEAVEEFRAAFLDASVNLHFQNNTVALIIQQTFEGHKVAYIKFCESLSGHKRSEFDEAWANYERYYNTYSKGQVYSLFASPNTEYESEHRKAVMALIKRLLEFAEAE